MARFDVYRRRGQDQLLLDCQADRLSHLTTRFVVPLLDVADVVTSVERLNPRFEIDGVVLVMATQLAAGVSVRELGAKVTTLADQDYRIIGALDVLTGTA